MPVSAFKATRYDRNQNLFLELRFFHAGLRGFFTGCGLRQQMHLEIFNASMDLFLINCIIFKVTKTFHTGLMNNLILLWKIVNYNILYSFEQFLYEKPQIMFFIS